ncbi:ribose transport system ATP-binding protein [Asanoa hainanensis]|uniref:Ribose transport system ATP-binding protein n=1 Tax=Asanoa hainanensis TaxID=560556 RepID=A0A239MAD0_9ACTN|nr:ribose transport system ATP-binding protein [Asanoa hainanensis]
MTESTAPETGTPSGATGNRKPTPNGTTPEPVDTSATETSAAEPTAAATTADGASVETGEAGTAAATTPPRKRAARSPRTTTSRARSTANPSNETPAPDAAGEPSASAEQPGSVSIPQARHAAPDEVDSAAPADVEDAPGDTVDGDEVGSAATPVQGGGGVVDDGAERPVVLRLTDVVKTFPGVRALDGVQLEVRAGEVHCLLGQNGAGKSTLIKVLSGAHQPDSGVVEWLGEQVRFANPQAANKAGIATIYQELDLVDDLSIGENAFLGHEPKVAGFVKRGTINRRTREILTRLGHGEIAPNRMVRTLPAAGKQVVSMARALSHEARLIIMDEPSAVLAHDEVENLFRIIRELTAQGIAVIYISHRLEEIREIGDRVTVLKDGRTTAASLPARTTPTRDLVSRMTGRSIEYVFPTRVNAPTEPEELLRVEGLGRAGEFDDISLTVGKGEIVGIAGLVGSGRSELLETIFGARQPEQGRIYVKGKALRPGAVGAAVRAGLGMAPEERKAQALLLGEPIYRNMTLSTFSKIAKFGFTDTGKEREEAMKVADQLELRPRDVRRPVRTLSGGNQQKVVVGRWLLGDTDLLLLDEPTRGVDVGARAELYQVIHALAAQGVGVLLVSSEVPEVLGLSDRVLVMREGRMVRHARAEELDEETVLDLVMAGSLMEGAPA